MDWLKRLRNALTDRQQKAAMVAAPIVINPNDGEKVKLAIYRLDAIARHIEQYTAAGRPISEERRREFRNEARTHGAFLLSQGRIGEREHDQLLKRAGVV